MAATRPDITIAQAVEAYEKHGSLQAAGDALGVHRSTVSRKVKMNGESFYHPPAKGFYVKGVSTLYNADGEVSAQWVKTNVERNANLANLVEALKLELSDIEPLPPAPAPITALEYSDQYLTAYPIGDAHFGMYAWGEESGDNFDLKIASEDLLHATTRLLYASPKTRDCLIINVGDFFHADDGTARTPQHGNKLDVDSRHFKVLRTGVRVFVRMVTMALQRHHNVYVVIVPGNHDPHSSMALSLALEQRFMNEPRVRIVGHPKPFYYHEFGKNLIGVTHGDTVKPEQLMELMATHQREAWGRVEYCHWITGHVHHKRVFESSGGLVESFRTLAAKDAWHHMSGYNSGRDMCSIVYHIEHGEWERHRVGISLLRDKNGRPTTSGSMELLRR